MDDNAIIHRSTLAIIGSSVGQRVLYKKAKEMGLRVIGFAWDKGVVEDGLYDKFYEISVTDTDKITEVCRAEKVNGVITNASEFLMPLASEIANRLGLPCTPPEIIGVIQSKEKVRSLTSDIPGLSSPQHFLYPDMSSLTFPCVVKPIRGASKRGVSYCGDSEEFQKAVEYASTAQTEILVEEFIPGREFSVESLSFRGEHYVVQITDKDSSGPPHFVELGHHQPSTLGDSDKDRVRECVRRILDRVGFRNGATHIEMKLDETTGKLYLIEINCRGGGDHISDTLVELSTDCDYIREMINISIDSYYPKEYGHIGYSGICYLSLQNKGILKYFSPPAPEWIVYSERNNSELSESTSNYDRDGFFIYKSSQPVEL